MGLAVFQEILRRKKLDLCFLAFPDPALAYFTQTQLSSGTLLITQKSCNLFLSRLDQKPRRHGWRIFQSSLPWNKSLLKTGIKAGKVRTIGVNYEQLTLSLSRKLKKIFPRARLADVSAEISLLRSQKSPEEVAKISRACALTDLAFSALVNKMRRVPLNTEKEVALFLEEEIRKRGGDIAFPTIVASGKNSAVPHHITSSQKLKRGFLLLDFGARHQNYCADISRVLFFGKPTAKELGVYNLLLKAQLNALAKIAEKVPFSLLDKEVRKNLGRFSSHFIHRLGHGVGIEVHEAPRFDEQKIQKGQVFTIEPGIYFPRKFGLRIEDTILFDGKVRVLTKSKKELCVLPTIPK